MGTSRDMGELNYDSLRCILCKSKAWTCPGDSLSFRFGPWALKLTLEDVIYSPFSYALNGKKGETSETWSCRYTSVEAAMLHVLNRFNENADIPNRYKTLDDAIPDLKRRG